MPNPSIDATDAKILRALHENSRTPLAELGRRIGLSQPAMSERVKRLEDKGILRGYSVRLDYPALGLGLGAIIRLATDHSTIHSCMEKLRSLPGVTEIVRATGDDCLFIRVRVRDSRELEAMVDAIARYGLVRTSVILSEETLPPPI